MPFTYVQQATSTDGTQVIFPSNNEGDALVATFISNSGVSSADPPNELTDSAGNTWTLLGGHDSGGDSVWFYCAIYYVPHCVEWGTTNTLNAPSNFPVGTGYFASGAEFTSVDITIAPIGTLFGNGSTFCYNGSEGNTTDTSLGTTSIDNTNLTFIAVADANLFALPAINELTQITTSNPYAIAGYWLTTSPTFVDSPPFDVSVADGSDVICIGAQFGSTSFTPPLPPVWSPAPGETGTITLGSNTYTLVGMPTSPGPCEIELGMNDSVSVFSSPFTQVQQTQQWPGGDFWDATITLPPMYVSQSFAWEGFLAELRGKANVFQLGDTRNKSVLGVGSGGASSGVSQVVSVAITDGGTYVFELETGLTPPTVVFTGTGFSATGKAVLQLNESLGNYYVESVTITNPGIYTGDVAVSFTGGSGIGGATGTVVTGPSDSPFVYTTTGTNLPMTTTLVTSGWAANTSGQLLPGDKFQVGYRLYRVCEAVDSDSDGNATIIVWPSLRETPPFLTPLILTTPVGLFRLQSNRRAIHWSPSRLTTVSLQCVEAR